MHISGVGEACGPFSMAYQLSRCVLLVLLLLLWWWWWCVQEGIDKFFEAAQAATAAMEEAAPLLEEATQLAKEITPLLQVN